MERIFNLNYNKYTEYLQEGVEKVNENFLDCYDTNVKEVAEKINEYGKKLANGGKVDENIMNELMLMFTVDILSDKALEVMNEKNKVLLFERAINNDELTLFKLFPFINLIMKKIEIEKTKNRT